MRALGVAFAFLVVVAVVTVSAQPDPWKRIDTIITDAIAKKAFPGAVAYVGSVKDDAADMLIQRVYGHFTYGQPAPESGDNPYMTDKTIFDLASLTKVLATTTAVAQFYERGELGLDDHLCSSDLLGPQFCADHPEKADITVSHCLQHVAGYPPDPEPGYSSKDFGCPETINNPNGPREVFSCQKLIHSSFMQQALASKPGEKFVYSDLSMMSMMWVVGKLARTLGYVTPDQLLPACTNPAQNDDFFLNSSNPIDQCAYEAYVRMYVSKPLEQYAPAGTKTVFQFLPQKPLWPITAPCENDTWYRHEVVQGQVHDENAYASGGIQGHAGLFATGESVANFGLRLMLASPSDPYPYNATTRKRFTTIADPAISSRALGWDTNHVDPSKRRFCGTLSEDTYFHTGFTGTLICNDPDRQLVVVLLTNRVYPTRNDTQISQVRQDFTTAVQQIYDNLQNN